LSNNLPWAKILLVGTKPDLRPEIPPSHSLDVLLPVNATQFPITKIPDIVWFLVFSYLDFSTILVLNFVCKNFDSFMKKNFWDLFRYISENSAFVSTIQGKLMARMVKASKYLEVDCRYCDDEERLKRKLRKILYWE